MGVCCHGNIIASSPSLMHLLYMLAQWEGFSQDDLNGLDTMIKRLLKKGLEQIVKKYDYYRVAVQQEMEVRSSHRRVIVGEERLSQRGGMLDYAQRRAIMQDNGFPQRSTIMDDDDDAISSQRRGKRLATQRKYAQDCERASQRMVFHPSSMMTDGDRSPPQRRQTVEPAADMNYQPHPLLAPYNQPFPQFQHPLPCPQGHEHIQAMPPNYLLEQYHSNQRPGPYYQSSCLPPGVPNFCVGDPETAMSKEVSVPTLCLEETYV